VKKFLLRAIAPGEEVNVIDHQHVDVAIAMTKLIHLATLNGGDELVDEAVAGEIQNARIILALENFLADGLEQVRLAQPDAAVNEQRIVRPARLLADGDGRCVRQPVARTGNKMIEDVIRAERQRLIALVEHAAARKVLTVKSDRDESAGHLLCRRGEGLLTLTLAEIQLSGRGDEHLNDAVGQLPRHQLVEPDTIEAGMLGANSLEYLLPGGWVNTGGVLRAAGRSLALRWRVGRDHFYLQQLGAEVRCNITSGKKAPGENAQ